MDNLVHLVVREPLECLDQKDIGDFPVQLEPRESREKRVNGVLMDHLDQPDLLAQWVKEDCLEREDLMERQELRVSADLTEILDNRVLQVSSGLLDPRDFLEFLE